MVGILRDDALTVTAEGLEVRVALPWIRSLPLSSVGDLTLTINGTPIDGLRVRLADGTVSPDGLAAEPGWWFLQDRLVLEVPADSAAGPRDLTEPLELTLSFRLTVPYLSAGPDAPVTVPIHQSATLTPRSTTRHSTISLDVA